MKFERRKNYAGSNETRIEVGPFKVVFNRLLTNSRLHPRFGLEVRVYLGMWWRQ